jgi:hypothetical protein
VVATTTRGLCSGEMSPNPNTNGTFSHTSAWAAAMYLTSRSMYGCALRTARDLASLASVVGLGLRHIPHPIPRTWGRRCYVSACRFVLLEGNTPYAFIRCGPAQVRRGPSLALSVSWVVFRAKASRAPKGRKRSRVCEMRLRLGPGFAWHGMDTRGHLDGCVSSVAGRGGGVIHRTPSTFEPIR